MLCPKCNTVNSDHEKYCKNCGFQLNASRICPQCGKVNQHNSKYCDECGATLSPVNSFKKDVISKEEDSSFFNRYKTALIAALILVLAIGAVTGITLYNGNDNGGDDEPFFPLVNGNNSQTDDSTVLNQSSDLDDNQTLDNKSADAKLSKNDTAANKSSNQMNSENKTDKINQVMTENKTDKINQVMTENKTDKTSPFVTDNQTNKSKVKTENKTDKTNQFKTENKTYKVNQTETENKTQKTEQINMNNKTNDSDRNNDGSSSFEIKMTDVPNLAKEVADRNYKFSQIDYKGHSYSESQCIYIFSKYVIKINDGDDSAISVKSVGKAPDPNADDLSQEISKSDYISMAKRIVSFIDSNNAVPNYVGVSSIGPKDLSPDKLLYLYTQIVLNYGVTGDLPESVEI